MEILPPEAYGLVSGTLQQGNSGPLSNVRYLKTQLLFSPDFGFNLLFGLWISISFSFALRIGIYRLQSFVSDWYVSASTLDFGSVSA
ncbi:unnamed protein product [Rhizophagus irregularis]|nr:unnamed protein product [Rhizophagus irregularis]